MVRQAVKAAAVWAAANPVKAAQLGLATAVVVVALWKTKRVDETTLRRALRILF